MFLKVFPPEQADMLAVSRSTLIMRFCVILYMYKMGAATGSIAKMMIEDSADEANAPARSKSRREGMGQAIECIGERR